MYNKLITLLILSCLTAFSCNKNSTNSTGDQQIQKCNAIIDVIIDEDTLENSYVTRFQIKIENIGEYAILSVVGTYKITFSDFSTWTNIYYLNEIELLPGETHTYYADLEDNNTQYQYRPNDSTLEIIDTNYGCN